MEQKINESTAILWDVENIHPKQTGSIIEKIEDSSRIAYAIAFGDWNRKECKSLCEEFAKHNFEMIHTPHIEKLKNTADISAPDKVNDLVVLADNATVYSPNVTTPAASASSVLSFLFCLYQPYTIPCPI